MKWQAVFFDFDGVILDSVDIKTEAFAKMFSSFGPDVEAEVVAYHLANGGISRFEKFRYFYKNILKQEISRQDLYRLGDVFAELVLKEVLAAPFVAGTLETLNQIKEDKIPAYIVSGTPQEEIAYIVGKKGLSYFFNEIHGSPRQKDEIISQILAKNNFQCSHCLFIGDALSDYHAAQKTGVCFLGIVKEGEKSPFPEGTLISTTARLDIH